MKISSVRGPGLKAAALVALARSTAAHSWIEMAYRIASNGTMIGDPGYPRGYVPRGSTNPPFSDSIPVWLLPATGQSAYSGDEILNKFPKQDSPAFPLLEASAGDYIALLHLENGHTTLPQNQPHKPQNRGTLFFYGTSQPRDRERLFDVHLAWNRDGTGGDGRGRLLGTRNYDDGQCYQPNDGPISTHRAQALGPDGALHSRELACQSDLRLPDDLRPGSVYTIYWYWDWPDLNAEAIDFDGTKNGIFPWAGTFMRGEKDPHGFSMAAISKNESYASTIDIKISSSSSSSASSHNKHILANDYVEKQNIYSKAIRAQLEDNFQVDIDAVPSNSPPKADTDTGAINSPGATTAATATSHGHRHTKTVTAFVTVWPTTTWRTLTRTASSSLAAAETTETTVTTVTTTEATDRSNPTPIAKDQDQDQAPLPTVLELLNQQVPAGSATERSTLPFESTSTEILHLPLATPEVLRRDVSSVSS